MKLRIRGDTLRLRLSQGDIASLLAEGRIEETAHFGPASALVYGLHLDPHAASITARYGEGRIAIVVPEAHGRAWATGDVVGFQATQPLEGDRALAILVEKDFKCLAPRPGEEAYDGFPNPAVEHGACDEP